MDEVGNQLADIPGTARCGQLQLVIANAHDDGLCLVEGAPKKDHGVGGHGNRRLHKSSGVPALARTWTVLLGVTWFPNQACSSL